MELSQTFSLRQSLAMTTRMQASLRILGMSAHALAEYLQEAERKNPYLTVRLPSSYVSGGSDYDPVAALAAAPGSLHAHVSQQIDLNFRTARDRTIAQTFAQALEPTGWLSASLEDIATTAGCTPQEAARVLEGCQEFEPAGLFARSLAECLRLQAADAGVLGPAMTAVLDNLEDVAGGKLEAVARAAGLPAADLRAALGLLRGFDPKPGLAYGDSPLPIQPPELRVQRSDTGWQVDLNRSTLPAIEVSVADDLDGLQGAARQYARTARAEARWIERTVARRHSTLLATATAIVAHQTAFLEDGPGHLRPLALRDIAEALGVHVSTISRAVSGRRIETPRAILPLKAFFSGTVGDAQEGRSRDEAMAAVRDIVAAEPGGQALSDAAIAAEAAKRGLRMSRRTVVKYRKLMGIPSSFQRRKRPAQTRAAP